MIKVYSNISQLLTLEGAYKKDGRNLLPEDCSILENASVVFNENEILWVGKTNDLPKEYLDIPAKDLKGKVLTPGLVDSHTHVVFGGNRAKEYTMRLNGADYEAIANAGGGILNTMNGTNNSSREELFKTACERVERIESYGVKTLEIKSGYGLNFEKEYEVSSIINDLKKKYEGRVRIFNTCLAAHAVPKSYDTSAAFMNEVVLPLIKKLAEEELIDGVDIFHEKGYFDESNTQQLFDLAKILNLKTKTHADEFNDNKGALLAANNGAISTDHLLCTEEDGIEALANSKTVATLLPGTGFYLAKPQANAKKFLEAGCKVAIGSDYNPGSCHCDNILLVASLAAPTYGMNITQMWSAITLNASHALDFYDQGAIVKGLKPSFTCFEVETIDEITYNWGRNLVADI